MTEQSISFEAVSSLRHLPRPLFQQLIAPHEAALVAAGVEPASVDALGLWAVRERLPSGLIDDIHRIHDMSDDAGYDRILHAAGGPLFVEDAGSLPAIVVAARTLIERPDQFNRAHGRRLVETVRKFREFPGRAPIRPSPLPDAVERAEARFGAFFFRRGRSALCRIRPWREGDNLHFLVSHGGCCRVDDVIHEVDGVPKESTLVWRPQQHDLVVLDARTGRLRVSAPDAPTLHAYVEGFGELLFGDPSWFVGGTVVSLDPLIRSRSDVLRPSRGILGVKLVELEVGSRSGSLASMVLKGDDVFCFLDESRLDPAAHGPLRAAKIRLRIQSDGRWQSVSIGVPDRVTGDWRRDGGVVRHYLEERGFLAGPPPAPASEVA